MKRGKGSASIQTRIAHSNQRIHDENFQRKRQEEVLFFGQPWFRIGIFSICIFSFGWILKATHPPREAIKTLEQQKVMYLENTEICFGIDCLENSEKIHKIKLPFFNFELFSDYRNNDLFYRFQVKSINDNHSDEFSTLIIPPVLGDSLMYWDGELNHTGNKFFSTFAIKKNLHELVIHVRVPSDGKFGIRSIYPPFISSREFGKTFIKELEGEKFQAQYSIVAQLAGFCLLLVLYLAFPYRPEVFSFLLLFLVQTIQSNLRISRYMGYIDINPILYDVFYNSMYVLAFVALFFFIAQFFRYPMSKIREWTEQHAWKVAIISGALYFALTYSYPTLSAANAFFIALWLLALPLSLLMAHKPLLYLIHKKAYLRSALGMLALAGVGYWVWANVTDHFVLYTKITPTYNNHLHFFFIMAVVLGIEIGRTEIRMKQAFSLLPTEVVQTLQQSGPVQSATQWREGYVMLLRVANWDKLIAKLSDRQLPKFIQKVNEYVLSHFDEPSVSVGQGTEDGFYLTCQGPPEEWRLKEWIRACEKIALIRPPLKDLGVSFSEVRDEKIIVRSAIGYGRYYFGFAQAANLRKDLMAGFQGTHLARVIGDHPDPGGPRILCGNALDTYRGQHKVAEQVTKGTTWKYWEP